MLNNSNYIPSSSMRINAHFASAILPNAKKYKSSTTLDMQNSQLIQEEIAQQKIEIRAICEAYNVNTTRIAEAAKLAPSIINRFMATEFPKNALIAVTLRKIKT